MRSPAEAPLGVSFRPSPHQFVPTPEATAAPIHALAAILRNCRRLCFLSINLYWLLSSLYW
jgi:hypothetical protein